jgi:hypothetical protein
MRRDLGAREIASDALNLALLFREVQKVPAMRHQG